MTLLFAFLLGCATNTQVADLEARLKALETKVETIESAGPSKKAAAPPVDTAREAEAGTKIKEAQAAIARKDYDAGRTMLKEVQEKYSDTKAGKNAGRVLSEVAILGQDAAPIQVEKWLQGKAEMDDAKATLLVFWEVWCPHCKREMPELAKSAAAWKKKGLQIIAVTKLSKDKTEAEVMSFLKDNQVGFPVGKEKGSEMSKAYNVTGIPAGAIVMDGKVVWRGNPATLNDAVVDSVVGS